MIQNFSVMENLELSAEEKAHLEEAKLVAGLYCDGCGECLGQCKKNLPVHELMRAYMYTYGYRQFENAVSVLKENKILENPCGDCTHCTVNCPKGFQIAERIADVSRLSSVPNDLLA
jgi:ferredoxin